MQQGTEPEPGETGGYTPYQPGPGAEDGPSTGPAGSADDDARRGRGVLGFAAVLLVILGLVVIGERQEIGRAYGVTGEQGTLYVEACGRPRVALEEQRSICSGTFTPDDGGAPYPVDALLAADPGDRVTVGADGPDETAYRADVWGRLGAIALPLIPIGLLWLVPGLWSVFRTPGVLDRGRRLRFLAFSVMPSALILAVAGAAFLVAVLTT